MCGRYEIHSSPQSLARAFGLRWAPDVQPRYNVAPTQRVPVIRHDAQGERELAQMRWGLVPHWAKDAAIGNRLINARGDTVSAKPSFRDAFRQSRCLVPADGFYEWALLANGTKQPMHISMVSGEPFAIAGLWSRWRDPSGEVLESCALITTDANELCAKVHDRMPVILAPEDYDRWMSVAERSPVDLIRPYPAHAMQAFPVSTRVNRATYDDPSLIERLAA